MVRFVKFLCFLFSYASSVKISSKRLNDSCLQADGDVAHDSQNTPVVSHGIVK